MVQMAPHLADRLRRQTPDSRLVRTTVDGILQHQLEVLARRQAKRLGPRTGMAILVVENDGRRVAAYLGSSDFADGRRQGQVDLVRAVRSPGSTLKPIIYALAFERGLIHPATVVNDVPTSFGDYAPANFMARHYGEVSAAEALRLSLNVPAVAVLDKLGPVLVAERLRRHAVRLDFGGRDIRPGLAFALGGVGTTLEDLVRLSAALAADGRVRQLRYLQEWEARLGDQPGDGPLVGAAARWYVGNILRAARPPDDFFPDIRRKRAHHIAFKTGTSYGFRDAWAVGYTTSHTVGVWVGRADGTPSPGRFGANTAAPVLFQVFDHLPHSAARPPPPPDGALIADTAELAPGLRYLGAGAIRLKRGRRAPPPRILFPLDDTVIAMPPRSRTLVLEAEGGHRPLSWMVNGRPIAARTQGMRAQWAPDGLGFSEIVLIDAFGRSDRARIRIVELDE